MDANQLLTSLGLAMSLPDLKFDASGCARLLFDQKLAVDFEYDADAGCIHVYNVLGNMPPNGSGEALYRKLLEGNLFGAQTRGAALALDANNREIVLCQTLYVDGASSESFASLVEKFLATIEHWQEQIAEVDAPDTQLQDVPALSPRMSMMFQRV